MQNETIEIARLEVVRVLDDRAAFYTRVGDAASCNEVKLAFYTKASAEVIKASRILGMPEETFVGWYERMNAIEANGHFRSLAVTA